MCFPGRFAGVSGNDVIVGSGAPFFVAERDESFVGMERNSRLAKTFSHKLILRPGSVVLQCVGDDLHGATSQ